MVDRTPSHRETTWTKDGEIVYEHFPIAQVPKARRCKYCYETHDDWWLMAKTDYGRDDVVLCGKCEYTQVSDESLQG